VGFGLGCTQTINVFHQSHSRDVFDLDNVFQTASSKNESDRAKAKKREPQAFYPFFSQKKRERFLKNRT
jgi:hypothetical protein